MTTHDHAVFGQFVRRRRGGSHPRSIRRKGHIAGILMKVMPRSLDTGRISGLHGSLKVTVRGFGFRQSRGGGIHPVEHRA